MKNEKYKKGNRLFWIGFLSGILFNVLPLFSTPDTYPGLAPFVPLFTILSLVSAAVVIYGCVLVLQSKNRHWAWALSILVINIFGVILVYMLKDESVQPNLPPTQTTI